MSANPKFIVWLREDGRWVEQGDGPMTEREAKRVASEIQKDFGMRTRVLPAGQEPLSN